MSVTITEPVGGHAGYAHFDCPKRPGKRCYVPIRVGPQRSVTWGWDGNKDKPTITPSIDCTTCGWHGFITNGETNP